MWGFWGSSFGFPGALPPGPFKEYIRANELDANHYYSAYPEATATMVLAALELAPQLARSREQARGCDSRGVRGGVAAVPDGRRSLASEPTTSSARCTALTVMTPIAPGAEPALAPTSQALRAVVEPARAAAAHALRPLGDRAADFVKDASQPQPDELGGPYLLFIGHVRRATSTPTSTSCSRAGDGGAGRSGGVCVGCPHPTRGAELKAYLLHNQIHTGLFFSAYPDATVQTSRHSLERREPR